MTSGAPLWTPDRVARHETRMAQVIERLRHRGVPLPSPGDPTAFAALHAWSIAELDAFWSLIWDEFDCLGERPGGRAAWTGSRTIAPPLGPESGQWFPGTRLNFAENLLRHVGPEDAVIAWDERGPLATLSRDQLRDEVARVRAGLQRLGVRRGDRVAGWLPNIPETVVAMLATTALGAVWTSCSPDFGVDGIVDRFGQTEPVVLLYADGYAYAGKVHDCTTRAAELLPRLPSVRHAIRIPFRGGGGFPPTPAPSTGTPCATPTLRSRRWSFAEFPSSTPSTCSIRRGRPDCPRGSCMAPAAPCCNTARSTDSISISAPMSDSSTSPPVGG